MIIIIIFLLVHLTRCLFQLMEEQVTEAEQEVIIANNNLLF